MVMRITFATSSRYKYLLASSVLGKYGIRVAQRKLDLDEIQAISIEEVVLKKARDASAMITGPLIVDDSGLYINSLNGFPGALLKPVYLSLGNKRLAALCKGKDRNASFTSVLVFIDTARKVEKLFSFKMQGRLAMHPMGNSKEGWEAAGPIFMPKGYDKTLAQFNSLEREAFFKNIENKLHYAQLGRWISMNYKEAISK